MNVRNYSIGLGDVPATVGASSPPGWWAMSAYSYQVIGFLIVWVAIVLAMVFAG